MKSLIASVLVFIAALCLFDMPMPVLNGSEIYGIITATVIPAVVIYPIALIIGYIPAFLGGIIGGVIGWLLPSKSKDLNKNVTMGSKVALYAISYPLILIAGTIMYANLYRGVKGFPMFTLWQAALIEISLLIMNTRMRMSK